MTNGRKSTSILLEGKHGSTNNKLFDVIASDKNGVAMAETKKNKFMNFFYCSGAISIVKPSISAVIGI